MNVHYDFNTKLKKNYTELLKKLLRILQIQKVYKIKEFKEKKKKKYIYTFITY